jgi:hypothetical protein
VTGSYDGRVYLVQQSANGYRAPVALRDRTGGLLVLGMYWDFDEKHWRNPEGVPFGEMHAISIAVVDWDDDGDTDLVAGTADGKVFRWSNLGSRKEAAFAERAEAVVAGGEPFALRGGHAMPTVADWDQDGRWDIVLGGDDGEVAWARNVGSAGKPAFAALQTLIAKADDTPGRSQRNALVEVADLNGDGRADLIVGDQDHEEVLDGRTAEQNERYAEVQRLYETYADARRALASDDEDVKSAVAPERMAEYQALVKEMRELSPKRRSLNGVWFYLRVPAGG